MTVTANDWVPMINQLIITKDIKWLVRCKSRDYLTGRGIARLLCCLEYFLRGQPHHIGQPAQISILRTTASRVDVCRLLCNLKVDHRTLCRFRASKLNILTPRSAIDSQFWTIRFKSEGKLYCSRTLCRHFHLVCCLAWANQIQTTVHTA